MSKTAAAAKKGRYQLKSVLGKGGMGVVYKAYDTATEREVTLKTIHDVRDKAALDLFKQEYNRQKSLSHPNIVDIFDIGELEENGEKRPYFTMPLLHGATLDDLIRDSSHRLTVERAVEITCGVCKGLQAAHDARLVHRDIKPSNIFVLEDDSVKILDFGIAHLVDKNSTVGFKGTLLYMSPEQLQNQRISALSDVFSLGAVCYEALTRRKAFEGATKEEVVNAILYRSPVPASELNPAVNQALSQVVHAAMAKEPFRRFSSAREFGEALQKAVRGEPIERFNPVRIQPRLERARKAFDEGDCDFASEILAELDAECWIDPQIASLRREVEAFKRDRDIRRLLDAASQRFKNEEYPLALQKIEEILRLDPQHAEALALRSTIETQHKSQKIADWFSLARRHIDNQAYDHARQALQNVLQVDPRDSSATKLLSEIDRLEQEHIRQRQLKEQLYHTALQDWQKGDVSNALSKLERLLDLDRTSPEHQSLYNQVRSVHDALKSAYNEARQHLQSRKFAAALTICDQVLGKYPENTLFQALKFDAESGQRQELSEYIAEVDREVEKEPDVDRKVAILEAAWERFPVEHFRHSLKLVRAKRDLVNSILEKARAFEANGQLGEALGQLEILRNISSEQPGLDFEIDRLRKRREQQAKSEAKVRWVGQIDGSLSLAEYSRALELLALALAEFPGDTELRALETLARQGMERSVSARAEYDRSRGLFAAGKNADALAALRRAHEFDDRNPLIRSSFIEQLLAAARSALETEWRAAEPYLQEALRIDPGNPAAKSIGLMLGDHQRAEFLERCLLEARKLQAAGDIVGALSHVESGLQRDARDPRLLQIQATLKGILTSTPAHPVTPVQPIVPSAAVQPGGSREQFQPESQLPSPRPAAAASSELEKAKLNSAPAVTGGSKVRKILMDVAAAPIVGALWVGTKSTRLLTIIGAAVLVAVLWIVDRFRGLGTPGAAIPLRRAWIYAVVGVGIALIGISALVKVFWNSPATEGNPSLLPVQVQTSPSGASVYVDGERRDFRELQLPPGNHTFRAVLEGYSPAEQTVVVTPDLRDPIRLALNPLPSAIRISSDLPRGQVSLDGQPVGALLEGLFAADAGDGRRTLNIASDGGIEATIGFETGTARMPVLTKPLELKQLQSVVVLSYLGKARVYYSLAPAKLTIGDQVIGEVPTDGLDLSLSPGVHTFLFGEGKDQRPFAVEIGAAPSVTAALSADRNIGQLEIVTNEDQFDLFIDDRQRKFQIVKEKERNRYFAYGLPVRSYTVRIARQGYSIEPEQAKVEIVKGRIQPVEFTLHRIPVEGTLQISGGPAGAQVTIGGNTHTIGQDGSLSIKLPANRYRVTIQARGHKPWVREYEVAEGVSVEIRGQDIRTERILGRGTVLVKVEPPNACVRFRPEAGGQERLVTNREFEVEEGHYIFKASAPDHMDYEASAVVSPGKRTEVSLTPTRIERKQVVLGMNAWEQTWIPRDNGVFVRKGGGFVTVNAQPPVGTYELTVSRNRGRGFLGISGAPHVRWLINYVDARNYEEFDIDPTNFTWRRIVAGREESKHQVKHGIAIKADTYQLRIQLAGDRLVQTLHDGSGYKALPGVRRIDANPASGKFGLHIQADEEVFIKDFSFKAASPAR